jgi:hypothetical protein
MISIMSVQLPVLATESEESSEPDYYAQAEERKKEEILSDQIKGWPEGP